MKTWRMIACLLLLLVLGVSLGANWLAPAGYAKQYRDAAARHPRTRIGWEPMRLAVTASHGFSTEPVFPFYSRPPQLFYRHLWPR